MCAHRASSEHNEQCAVMQWCDLSASRYPDLEWVFAIPNGAKLPYFKTTAGKRVSFQAMWLIKEGLKAGVSDLFAPFARGIYHGAFIEMKYGDNKATVKQVKFLKTMARNGYLSAVCWGADSTIELLEKYVKLGYNMDLEGEEIKDAIIYKVR
jgi:hypothetical protein